METWKDVTNVFTEDQRHYYDTYLEIDEVYNEELEVSLFSRVDGPYEIYISYDIMYGIIYAEEDVAYQKREEIKRVLLKEYLKNPKVTDEFINSFGKEYKLTLPANILF